MARKRFGDVKSAGRSHLCPFDPTESSYQRHARRKEVAHGHEDSLRAWCESQGLTLNITNQGHHWKIEGKGLLFEWWPSSAKLVFNKRYGKGVHCHDYLQVILVIGEHLPLHQDRPQEETP